MTPVKEIQEGQTLTTKKLVNELLHRKDQLETEMDTAREIAARVPEELEAIEQALKYYKGTTSTRSASTKTRSSTTTRRVTRKRDARAKWREKILAHLGQNDSVRMADMVNKAGRQKASATRAFRELEKEKLITQIGEYNRSPLYKKA